jgi:hypothetical protein
MWWGFFAFSKQHYKLTSCILILDYSIVELLQSSFNVCVPQGTEEGVKEWPLCTSVRPLHCFWRRFYGWANMHPNLCSKIKQTTDRWKPQVENSLSFPFRNGIFRIMEIIFIKRKGSLSWEINHTWYQQNI